MRSLCHWICALTIVWTPIVASAEEPSARSVPARELSASATKMLALLDAEEWREREAATRWLVAHPEEWVRSLSVEWQPATAEGRWRLRQVHAELAELQSLAADIALLPWGQLCWKFDQLRRRSPESAMEGVELALRSSFQRVRQRAVELTERLPVETRLKLILPLEHDSSPWVRQSVYEAVSRAAPDVARSMLVRTLRRHETPLLLREAILATRAVGVTPEIAALIRGKWVRKDASVRSAIALVLLRFPTPADRAICHWAIQHTDSELVRLALVALEQIGGADDAPAVIDLLGRGGIELRREATQWLLEHGNRTAAPALLPLLDAEDRDVVRRALGILVAWNALDTLDDVEGTLERIRAPREWLEPRIRPAITPGG